MSPARRAAVLEQLTDAECDALLHDWTFVARPNQLEPPGEDWEVWLAKAGRGWGKTRVGAEWVRKKVKQGYGRIALVGPTAADVRDTMIEGVSGLLSVCWDKDVDFKGNPMGRPYYEPSKRRVTWENGAMAVAFSAEEPERLRGPQHDGAWCDELAAWEYAQATWDMLQFGLRLGRRPLVLVTSTPKPLPLVREIARDPKTIVTNGSMEENAANLSKRFIAKIKKRYEGTRLGKQEIHGELLEDVPGALWTAAMIEQSKRDHLGRVYSVPEMERIVVAIDPSGTRGKDDSGLDLDDGDEIGIIVAGKGVDGFAYVLEDLSLKASPNEWAGVAISAYHRHQADRVVAERNFGGAMVEAVIRAVQSSVSYGEVTASRGKVVRAEPIAAFYEKGEVRHVGTTVTWDGERKPNLDDLEAQMMAMTRNEGYVGEGSPDRVDALVWALTELMLDEVGESVVIRSIRHGR
jgi:phage terminase large subunit-like protein